MTASCAPEAADQPLPHEMHAYLVDGFGVRERRVRAVVWVKVKDGRRHAVRAHIPGVQFGPNMVRIMATGEVLVGVVAQLPFDELDLVDGE